MFQRMKDTPQSPIHHPEGNVFIHTALVYDSVSFAYGGRVPYAGAAALFHDAGKPATFKVKEDGRITAYGHETVSEDLYKLFQPVIFPEQTEFEIQATAFVIRNHMKAKRFHEMRPAKVQAIKDEARSIQALNPDVSLSRVIQNPFDALISFAQYDSMTGAVAVRRFNSPHFDNDEVKNAVTSLEFLVRYLQSRVNVHNMVLANAESKSRINKGDQVSSSDDSQTPSV
jgi:hypothetical protein